MLHGGVERQRGGRGRGSICRHRRGGHVHHLDRFHDLDDGRAAAGRADHYDRGDHHDGGTHDGGTHDDRGPTTTVARFMLASNIVAVAPVSAPLQAVGAAAASRRDGSRPVCSNSGSGSTPNRRVPGEIASGDSVTPNGLHRVDRQRPDGWWDGNLGSICRPKYFVGGVVVHGSDSIPQYPASHGCVRVSVPAMDWIWESEILPLRTPVWVHDGV